MTPDAIDLSLGKILKAIDTGETGLSLESRHERMLADLFRKEAVQSLAECVRECVSW